MEQHDYIKTSKLVLIALAAWTLASALATLSSGLYWISEHKTPHWAHIFWHKYTYAIVWCLMLPILLRIVKALPLEKKKWWELAAGHGLAAIILAPIHRFLSSSLDFFVQTYLDLYSMPIPTLWGSISDHFVDNSIQGMTTYAIIVSILYGYFFYWRNLKDQLTQVQLTADLSTAKLKNLESQLQPHFLFNTMQSISALMHKDVEQADAAMSELSDLLRMAFQKGEQPKIPLGEELNFCQKYVALQQLRFQEDLDIQFSCPDDLKKALVPAMLLQPFIENSIKHGFEPFGEKGRIQVSFRRQNQQLVIEIKDNGKARALAIKKGTGFKNTLSRLEFLYKDHFCFEYGELEKGGFFVKMKFPIEQ